MGKKIMDSNFSVPVTPSGCRGGGELGLAKRESSICPPDENDTGGQGWQFEEERNERLISVRYYLLDENGQSGTDGCAPPASFFNDGATCRGIS